MAENCNCTSDSTSMLSAAQQWFSSEGEGNEGPNGWRLDVVTLLAVIGESSIADHAQTITASMVCLLPRIIPAPQALLKPSRQSRLPETAAKITGVYSGTVLETIGFFANIIHPLEDLKPFSFKVLEIKHTDRNNAGGFEVPQPAANGAGFLGKLRPGARSNTGLSQTRSIRLPPPPPDAHDDAQPSGFSSSADVEAGQPSAPVPGVTRRPTMREKVQDFVANPTLANMEKRPAIPAKIYSPVHILSVFSFLLTAGIIILAAVKHDGTAIVAVSLIAIASSVVGWASWWRPILMNRSHTNKVPEGDVIIRTREGAFLLVKCTEEVARELYSGTDECEYHVGVQHYRILMGFATFLLMVSVILLGNCKWDTQIFIGAAYITLNGMYWAMALLPRKYFWDLSRYEWKDTTPVYAQNAHLNNDESDPREGTRSFTRTLWYAIRETKRTAWAERSGAAPNTEQWSMWLAEAQKAAKEGNIKWPSVARKDEIMKMKSKADNDQARSPVETIREYDEAEQKAPLVEVQPAQRNQAAYSPAL
ncbi:hypothetical protein F4778DRAFT_525012 [Xylariomycetidae sp. FL2044]|nr:hypothetical protein F4778DRAFT_525012 [Xylariomycetidae sp. FL2044]